MIITVSKNGTILNRHEFTDQVIMGQSSSFLIGRADDAQVRLDDPQISRQLISLNFDGFNWSIKKLSEYDTILLNNAPMFESETAVQSNYFIICKDYRITFEELEAPENDAKVVEEDSSDIDEIDLESENIPIVEEEDETAFIETSDDESQEQVPEDDLTQDYNLGQEDNDVGFADSFDNDVNESQEDDQNVDSESDNFGEFSDDSYDEGYDQDYGDDFDNQSYDVDTLDGDDEDKTQVFSGFANFILELFGEDVPYDHFNLDQPETYIGRDPNKCQIVLTDPEVSSVHAVIRKNRITCVLEDLQSANGTILNGKRINQKEITNGDEFIIGSTTFTVKIASDFIKSQQDMLMPVEENQEVEIEEIIEVADDSDDLDDLELSETPDQKDEKSGLKAIMSDPDKRKKFVIYPLVGIALYFVLFADGGSEKTASKKNTKAKQEKVKKKSIVTTVDKKLTSEQQEKAEALYQLATRYANEGNVARAITEFEKLFLITKDYKQAQTFYQLAKDKYAELEKAEQERRAEEKRKIIKAKVDKLLEKAQSAVKERNVTLSKNLFQQIKELDPDNYDVANLELEINAYVKEKNRKELEEAQKKAERQRMIDALKPGEKLFLQEEWFKAINALEIFISEKDIAEDLMKKAVDMLKKSRQNLKNITGPLMGKARSLKEAEDLKAAYEVFKEVLRYNPNEIDAQNELDDINQILTSRARKVYRQGLVSESLGAYEDAREKFQEVQQISPVDNEYYIKATKRLKNL